MAKATLHHPCFQCHRLLWGSFEFESYKRQCVVDWFPVNLCCYEEPQACALTSLSGPLLVFVICGKGCGVWQTGRLLTIPVAKPCGVWAYKDLGAVFASRSYLIGPQFAYQQFFIQVQEPEKISNQFCANVFVEASRKRWHTRVSLWPLVAAETGVHCINCYCWSKRSCSGLHFSSHKFQEINSRFSNLLKKQRRGMQ